MELGTVLLMLELLRLALMQCEHRRLSYFLSSISAGV